MFNRKRVLTAATAIGLLPLLSCAPAMSGTLIGQLMPPAVFVPPQAPKPTTPLPVPAPTINNKVDETAIEARILLELGDGAEQDGKLLDAINIYKHVVEITTKGGAPTLDTAVASGRIAAISSDLRNLAQALKYCKLSLSTFEKLEGPVSNDVGIELNNLAWVEEQLGERAQAETTYRQALSVFGASPDQNDDLIGISYNNLGDLLSGQHRYREANRCYRSSLSFFKRFFGDEHPLVKMARRKVWHSKRQMNAGLAQKNPKQKVH